MITHEELLRTLSYDPEAGAFRWLILTKRSQNKIGDVAGCDNGNGYRRIIIKQHKYFAHRLAWFYMTGEWAKEVDHIDLNPSNNRWNNLRKSVHSRNQANCRKRSHNQSGFKGVSPYRGRWRAAITVNGKHGHLGMFDDPAIAHEAYKVAAQKAFGEFARFE